MHRVARISINATAAAAAAFIAGSLTAASAQAPMADKALSTIVGKWVNSQGRTIEFRIRDYNAVFEDDVEPGVSLTGAYRRDDGGAGYVLNYSKGFTCRYDISVITGADGNELVLRLVSSDTGQSNGRFKCLTGQLKRTR